MRRVQMDLGRRSYSEFGKKKEELQEQIGRIKKAKKEYEAYTLIDRIGIGSGAKMADIARDEIKREETEYDRMSKTEETFEREHKADLGETLNRMGKSAGYGVAKSFGNVVDSAKAIGAGVAAGFENIASEKFKTAYDRAYQESLTDGTSLYDKIDAEYQRERERADKTYGTLNVFTNYVDMAAHSTGEQAFLFWASAMASALAGGAKIFTAIGSAADDMIAGGGKIAKAAGNLLKKVDAGTVGGAIAMYTTASAQATKEAVIEMNNINEDREAIGRDPLYTQEEIEQKAARYGVLNGLSESVLEYAMGGLTGTKRSSDAVKNPMLTALLGYVKGSLGEGTEEIVQSLASYGIKRAIYDGSEQLDWQEVIDSGIVGAITGFGMGLPSAVQNTRAAADVQKTVHYVAREANNAKTEAERTVVMLQAEALAQSSEEFAQKMREDGSEGADTIADIYEWQAKQAESITKALADTVNDENDGTEGAQDAQRLSADTQRHNAEIERTGRAAGADEGTMTLAREVSSLTGRGIRFFSQNAEDGYINNGYYDPDENTIHINVKSKNPAAQILSHELTHSIEGTDSYGKLRVLIFDRMKKEGYDIDAEYRKKEMMYTKAGVRLRDEAEIAHEVIAEYVEKNLLTDGDKITSLVNENRTLGQRIREFLDSVLARMGNADAQQRDFIRRARDMYAKALGEGKTSESSSAEMEYHISKTEKGQPFVTIDRDILAGVPQNAWQKTVVDNLKAKFPQGVKIANQNIQFTDQGIDEIAYSKQAQWLYQNDTNTLADKLRASDNADEILRSTQGWVNEGAKHKRKDDIVDFARGNTLIRVGRNDYEADVLVARLKNNELMLYDIYNLNPTTITEKETGTVKNANPSPSGIRNPANISSQNSISRNDENVKREFSVSEVEDSEKPADPLAGVSSAVETEVEEIDDRDDGITIDIPQDIDNTEQAKKKGGAKQEKKSKPGAKEPFTRERAMQRADERDTRRAERKKIAEAETAFRRLGYKISGAVADNYADFAGIMEDTQLAAQAKVDIDRYIEDNNVSPRVDNAAKLIAMGEMKANTYQTGLSGGQPQMASELSRLYKQYQSLDANSIKAHGRKMSYDIAEVYDKIFDGFDWLTIKNKKVMRKREQWKLSLSNPEQVMRDVFGVTDPAVAEALNDYIIRPTIENSAAARRHTNKQIEKLRSYNLTEGESGMTQIFAEYSNTEKSGRRKPVLTEESLRSLLMGDTEAEMIARRIGNREYGRLAKDTEATGERVEFEKSIVDMIELTRTVNRKRASERAMRDYKAEGGSNAGWNTLSAEQKQKKIDAAMTIITDESVARITDATAEMRVLLDDMFEAINSISVIHGAQPMPFRRGYMPHSHRQTEEVQKWFNDHMGGINVTPVGDLPTDIAGKTAGRKPNKRFFRNALERTGPRTTWDALGNIEDYLQIANDTIYHIDDIRKTRVLERYVRAVYSVAQGKIEGDATKKIKNDVLKRLHGEQVDLGFLGIRDDKPQIKDEDMDLAQMATFVTWLEDYANDLAAKQLYNRDIERFAGRKYNNIANMITSWSSRVMMQYNISSNLKQLSQLGTVSGDVGARISKDAAALTLKSMRNLGNGTNDLEQKYHISERSTFLAEKLAVEEAEFASNRDLTDAQKKRRDDAAEIWDYAWSFTDTTMSRFAVYSYFLEGMQRGMDDTAALQYADTKARNILASRMKGSSPLIFQSKNPILRLFTMFQREPLAAWEDILKTMPREYAEMQKIKGEKEAKIWMAKRIAGRVLGASMVNTFYAAVLGLGTPAMFDILAPLSAILEKIIGDLTEDEEDDQTWGETLKGFGNNLKNEIADDIPFASLIAAIANTAAGTEFESRLPINAPDIDKLTAMFTSPAKVAKLTMDIANAEDAETIEALTEDRENAAKQIPFAILSGLLEIVGTAAPAGNQIRKSATGLITVLRGGEYDSKGRLKYEVGGMDAVRAVTLGKSNTKAAQEWVAAGFGSYSEDETDAYNALVSSGVGRGQAADYVNAVSGAEKLEDETKAQAEARILDGLRELDDDQRAALYYELVATDSQIKAIDAATKAGADKTGAVMAARSIRELKKRGEKVDALIASDMEPDAKRVMYDLMITDDDGDKIDALSDVGLDFEEFLAAKSRQSALNADETLTASQRATRFMAWIAAQGYTEEQEETVSDTFAFASGFKVQAKTYEKLVGAEVTAENAVTVTDALSGAERDIDKINAIWGTGIIGKQLDAAIKAVVSETQYNRYRIIIDANVPLEIYTWVLDNADADGNGSISNDERILALSRLALPQSDLSALWLATGGSEKSNPYGGRTSSLGITMPQINLPKIEIPKLDLDIPMFDFEYNLGGNK